MPIYPYWCEPCDVTFEVVKKMDDSHTKERCPKCAGGVVKGVAAFQVDKLSLTTGSGISTTEFNPGLGCWTESTRHAEKIAASRGLEPVGNEKPETLHKIAEKQQAETKAWRWAKADRVMLYE